MKLTLKSEEGDLAIVQVAGELSQKRLAHQADPLGDLLGEEGYRRTVLFDLRQVTAIDSSGVGWLLSAQKSFRMQGGKMVLHSLSPFARDVLKILNMQLVFQIAENEAAARRLVQEPST